MKKSETSISTNTKDVKSTGSKQKKETANTNQSVKKESNVKKSKKNPDYFNT